MVRAEDVPEVSVVIPCYNSAKFLGKALESVIGQSFQDWEIIAIDDGSSDETQTELDRYVTAIRPQMKVITQQNKGAAVARNIGISAARGKYVAFIDSDDIWDKQKLEKQLGFLRHHGSVHGVTTAYRLFKPGHQKQSRTRTFNWNYRELCDWVNLGSSAPALCSSLLIEKKFLKQTGGFDESLGSHAEDPDLAWRLFTTGKLASLTDCLTYIRKFPHQGHRNTQEMARSLELFHGKHLSKYPKPFLQSRRSLQVYLSLRLAWEHKSLRNLVHSFSANPLGHLSFLGFRIRSALSTTTRDLYRYVFFRLNLALHEDSLGK